MIAQHSEHTTHRSAGVILVVLGLLAVAALMAAMAWVVQGQVQQAEVVRAQWQGSTRASRVMPADGERGSPAQVSRNGNGLMAASFDKP